MTNKVHYEYNDDIDIDDESLFDYIQYPNKSKQIKNNELINKNKNKNIIVHNNSNKYVTLYILFTILFFIFLYFFFYVKCDGTQSGNSIFCKNNI
jgi:ATP-dependent Zn protease